jgi:hypothetical protein
MAVWHPNAKRVPIPSAPQNLTFTGGGHKLVWHTTEGSSIEGAESAYRAAGVCPHFTIALVNGHRVLHQHLPLDVAASALKHDSGPQTNRANAIQVEIVGFASSPVTGPIGSTTTSTCSPFTSTSTSVSRCTRASTGASPSVSPVRVGGLRRPLRAHALPGE